MGANGMKDRIETHFHISGILLPTYTPPTSSTELFHVRQRFLLDIVSGLHWHTRPMMNEQALARFL
jgi:hypothetical protein